MPEKAPYINFEAFYLGYVLPLKKKHPTALRLDLETEGSSRDVAVLFRRKGAKYEVHGDTRLEPLELAYKALVAGEEPFIEDATKKGRKALRLSPHLQALRADATTSHLYIYEKKK
jgi:hypothetical protein